MNGRQVPLTGARLTIGRDPENDLVLGDALVSRHHAVVEGNGEGGLTITDLDSGNGTYIGSRMLRNNSAWLRDGDELRLGDTLIIVSLPVPAAIQSMVVAESPVAPPAQPDPQTQPGPSPEAQPAPSPQQPQPAIRPRHPPPASAAQPSLVMRVSRTTQSAVIRQLQRSSRWSLIVAIVAVLVAIGVGAAAALGVFSSSTPTATQIANAVAPATVYVFGQGSGFVENGSGWVYDASRGLIVTNDHVAEGASSLTVGVGTAPGAPVAQRRRAATIVGAAPCEDVALIKISDTAGLKTMALGSQSALGAGDPVVALGFPVTAARARNFQNAVLIVTSGSVSSPRTTFDAGSQGGTINYPNVVQTDTVINHGSSGGPLVNFNKQIVGMNTVTFNGGSANVSGENYAIGVDRIKALIPRLENGSIGSAGFILDPGVLTDATDRGVTGLPQGIAVDGAVNGSPAAALPTKYYGGNAPPYSANNPPPTVLTSINGTQLSDSKVSYCQAVGRLTPGQNATIGLAVPGLDSVGQIAYRTDHYQVVFK